MKVNKNEVDVLVINTEHTARKTILAPNKKYNDFGRKRNRWRQNMLLRVRVVVFTLYATPITVLHKFYY